MKKGEPTPTLIYLKYPIVIHCDRHGFSFARIWSLEGYLQECGCTLKVRTFHEDLSGRLIPGGVLDIYDEVRIVKYLKKNEPE